MSCPIPTATPAQWAAYLSAETCPGSCTRPTQQIPRWGRRRVVCQFCGRKVGMHGRSFRMAIHLPPEAAS